MRVRLHEAYPIVNPQQHEDACCRSHRSCESNEIYGQQLSYIPPLGWIPLTPILPSDASPKKGVTPCPRPCSVIFSMFK